MQSLTETLAKKHQTQPSKSFFRGFELEKVGNTWQATRGQYKIIKSSYQSLLSAIKKQ